MQKAGVSVEVVSCVEGAREGARRGITVVLIDVFRASSTIVTLLDRGVKEILPVLTVEEALRYKEDFVLIGERGEIRLEEFDYDSSPSALSELDWKDKRVVLTTTNGTEGLLNAKGAAQILTGCFLNASAIARYIAQHSLGAVLVPIGNKGEKRLEDELCAILIKSYIMNESVNVRSLKSTILQSPVAQRLKKRGLNADLNFCLQIDVSDTIPRLEADMKLRKTLDD